MQKKSFSIFLPVRNGGIYLPACVESILKQDFKNFDLVILDNASDDGTGDWLKTLTDPRVTVHWSERSLSIAESWARILVMPKNEFLTVIGHDDLLEPDFLGTIIELIHDHPDAGLYLTHFKIIDHSDAFLRYCRPMPERETSAEFLAARFSELRDSFGTGHVMRSAIYEAIGGIPAYTNLLFADDALFVKAIGSSYRATASKSSFSYRLHSSSISGAVAMKVYFQALEEYMELLKKMQAEDCKISEVLQRYFAGFVLRAGCILKQEELAAAFRERRPVNQLIKQKVLSMMSFFNKQPNVVGDNGMSRLVDKAMDSKCYLIIYHVWRILNSIRHNLREMLKS